MQYRLLALDIDGTIVAEGTDEISKPVASAIKKASERVVISLVTARSHDLLSQFLPQLNCPKAFHVVENGAKIISPSGQLLRDLHIPHAEVQEILDNATGHYREVGFCTDNHWIEDEESAPYGTQVNGLSFTCDDEVHANMIRESVLSMPQQYACYVIHHWQVPEWSGVMVFHKDATKGNGMSYIQETLGISPEETIAVGDGGTDISMYDYAGLRVAMGNAEDVLKQKADFIAPSVDEDGLVQVIENYILKASPRPNRPKP